LPLYVPTERLGTPWAEATSRLRTVICVHEAGNGLAKMNVENPTTIKVAVVGARGIGKHHAEWWAAAGADLCAFAGTSEETVAQTRGILEDRFGFHGRGYVGVAAMLDNEAPDIVDVCSPHQKHAEHVRAALEAGCHVLCEKPLVFAPGVPREALVAQGRDLVQLAEGGGRRLGVCTQYAMAASSFLRIWRERRSDEPIREYRGHLESPARGRGPDPRRVWVDLSPHLISVAQRLAPDGEVDWHSAKIAFNGYEARAAFDVRRPSGGSLHCELLARNATAPPRNVRKFVFNDYEFVVEGETGPDGVYGARIETPDGGVHEPDAMRALIQAFLAGETVADGHDGLINLDIMLQILELGTATGRVRADYDGARPGTVAGARP